MGRRRGGGGGGASAKSTSTNSGGLFGRKAAPPPSRTQAAPAPAARAPPPPASAPPPPMQQHAPPPMQSSGGGGMLSGIGGMVAQGMALGAGSAIGHKVVDGVAGAFSGSGSQEAAPAPAPQMPAQDYNINTGNMEGGTCGNTQRDLYQCLQEQNNNAAACQFYFDALRQCQENAQFQLH